ncbi:MAG: NTP transferase domain-containing protein, partial [Oricola sp.]|nr:NTP transferase domain-containing protein [Oricola sp.]
MSNSSDFTPVILAGGKGTRLWPMSRSARPKQFLALTGEWSLFQATLLRLRETGDYADPLVVTNEEYRFLVAEQAAECGVALGAILLEPVARNTAPADAAASAFAENRNPGTLVHILPSDHEVRVDDAYRQAVATAVTAAEAGQLVTFGITPTEPATGYGYIEAGQQQESGALTVSRFVEKPDAGTAQKM